VKDRTKHIIKFIPQDIRTKNLYYEKNLNKYMEIKH